MQRVAGSRGIDGNRTTRIDRRFLEMAALVSDAAAHIPGLGVCHIPAEFDDAREGLTKKYFP